METMPISPLDEIAREGIEIRGPLHPGFEEILSPAALKFLGGLHRRFDDQRLALLDRRDETQTRLDAGWVPDFAAETAAIRHGVWTVAPAPPDLRDRRVEITGPVDRKMIIHALNSGASVFMADFEDATSPTWDNMVGGQLNLRDAVGGTISYSTREGQTLRLDEKVATLMVRPRGWHLPELHVLVDGRPMAGSLFDFGLFLFHNAVALTAKGSGPYFYLPKLENHREARLWNEVFVRAERTLGLPLGTIKATVLIETILAAFEMDEILYALKDHSAGLNCGRWDYIFSVIKKFQARPDYLLPDRSQVTMDRPFLRAYTQLVVKTCHRRGAHAIGGMAAQIPIKSDPESNLAAMEKVVIDKTREVNDGHDGTWVAHPGLVQIVAEIFTAGMPGPNQITRQREDIQVSAADLLTMPKGTITEAGLRLNIEVAIRYLEAWLRGQGCVPIHNLMEDTATAEISRAQVWQWIHHQAALEDGRSVTEALYRSTEQEELDRIRSEVGEERWSRGKFVEAAGILNQLILGDALVPFMTLPAYAELVRPIR